MMFIFKISYIAIYLLYKLSLLLSHSFDLGNIMLLRFDIIVVVRINLYYSHCMFHKVMRTKRPYTRSYKRLGSD